MHRTAAAPPVCIAANGGIAGPRMTNVGVAAGKGLAIPPVPAAVVFLSPTL